MLYFSKRLSRKQRKRKSSTVTPLLYLECPNEANLHLSLCPRGCRQSQISAPDARKHDSTLFSLSAHPRHISIDSGRFTFLKTTASNLSQAWCFRQALHSYTPFGSLSEKPSALQELQTRHDDPLLASSNFCGYHSSSSIRLVSPQVVQLPCEEILQRDR